MNAEQLADNVPTTHVINGLAAAKAACQRLRDRGAVVLGVTVSDGRPVIRIERPPRQLKAAGEVVYIVRDDDGRRVVHEQVFDGCAVRWWDAS